MYFLLCKIFFMNIIIKKSAKLNPLHISQVYSTTNDKRIQDGVYGIKSKLTA